MWRLSATTVFSLLNISALAQTPPCAWHWLLCLASLCAIFAPVPSVSPPGTFLFFFCFFFCLCEENVLETVCGSYANFRTIVWVSNTSPVMEKMCLHAEHHANVCVGIHMFKCITLPFSVNVFLACSSGIGWIWVYYGRCDAVLQQARTEPVVPDMVLSAAPF